MTKLSSNAMCKAIATEPDLTKQNQACEVINVDLTDMVEQILTLELDGVPPAVINTPKTVHDVTSLVAQAAMRLRVIIAVIKEQK